MIDGTNGSWDEWKEWEVGWTGWDKRRVRIYGREGS